jgi:ribonuclease P protein component
LERRRETLSRGERLTRRPDFLAVQERGRRFAGPSYLLFALPRAATQAGRGRARLGITVSKKIGKAAQRNRVKRWVRESYRRMSDLAPAATDLVVVARAGAAARGYRATADELRSLLRRLAS